MNGELLSQVLSNLFSWDVFAALAFGAVYGMIGGALPGVSSTMAVALAIPLSYNMKPLVAMAMLTAVYTSATYGGGITAILCHTPGDSSSAATAIDGYELTLQGKGSEALGASTLASSFGGAFGALVMIAIAPTLGRLSLKFGAPEFFLLSLFGLIVVAPLSGESMVKGLFMGATGLFLGTWGMDATSAAFRYTFGLVQLENGLSLVPLLIGVFSVSQILSLADDVVKGRTMIITDPSKGMSGKHLPPWPELKATFPAMTRSSIMGTLIGIVPAAGPTIASWVCYSVGKKRSKHPEMFGKGSYEGVVCSEAANNSCCGGALIPGFTLGIPGSTGCALIMSAMIIHGLQPGQKLFTTQAPEIYSIFGGYFLANVIFGIIGLLLVKYIAKISAAPAIVLCPIILCLATIGSFAIRNNLNVDVAIMLIFGAIGYLLSRMKFPMAPLVLGMVLSKIVENNYRRSLILARDKTIVQYILSRPICVGILIILAVVLLYPRIRNIIKKKVQKGDQ